MPLQPRGRREVLKAGEELGAPSRVKVSKQFGISEAGKFLAQARRLPIQFGKLGLLFAPPVFHPEAADSFQGSCPRIDLAAQNALRFGDNLQEQEG